ncbi:MAG: diguanylate cyclase, partial [Enterobacter ludwigii]|nr:diguanylate cyclase [Enterobacter ludwigii]
ADLLVRFGGDEFAVLFADTDEQGAWIAMQYLAEQVENYNARKLHPWSLLFSWGLSEFDHNGHDLQQWLKEADEKMYAMKQQRHRER